MDTILIYFPDTKNYNSVLSYELVYQEAAIRHKNRNIILIDGRYEKNIEKIVLENKIKLFIVSTLIKFTSIAVNFQIEDGLQKTKQIKNISDIPVLWTGLIPTVIPNDLLNNNDIDYILTGQSDHVLNKFADGIINNNLDNSIKGLGYKDPNNELYINKNDSIPDEINVTNLDYNKINFSKYIHNNTIDYLASTGCPNNCSFCSVPIVYNRKWRHKSVERIINDIKNFIRYAPNIKNIHFRDDNFMGNKKFVIEIANEFIKNNLNIRWSAQTSVNLLKVFSTDELKLLKKSGCSNISFGIESGDLYILDKITKQKTSITESLEVLKALSIAGISPSVTSIISFPFNNNRDVKKTLKLLMKIKLIYPNLSMYSTFWVPIPKTELFNNIKEKLDYNNGIEYLIRHKATPWTSEYTIKKIKLFEEYYFSFSDPLFYKKVPKKLSKKIHIINIFIYPLIRLRFKIRCTSFLFDGLIILKYIKYIKKKYCIQEDELIANAGVRHLTSNQNFGYKLKK